MANNCIYDMKIIGTSEENVNEFIGMLTYDNQERYFSRIFSADVYKTTKFNDKYIAQVAGDCAWSVHSCMCNGVYTYYDRRKNDDEHLTNLAIETKRLSLVVEIFSEEPGGGFAEHYIYDNGKLIIEEETDFGEYWLDDLSIPEFLEEYKLELTPDQLDFLKTNKYVELGGFDGVFTI